MAKTWTEQEVNKILELMRTLDVDSLNRQICNTAETDTCELGDMLEDPRPGPQEQAELTDRTNLLLKIVSELDPRERMIITLRYGLKDGKFRTLEELAAMYNVTRERIRQAEQLALKRLRWLVQCKYKLKMEDL